MAEATLEGTQTDDAYHSVAELAGRFGQSVAIRLIEGFLYALSNGLTWRYGDETRPDTSRAGGPIPAGSGIGVGPVKSADASWDLRKLWVRNTTAGSNGTVVLIGQVE